MKYIQVCQLLKNLRESNLSNNPIHDYAGIVMLLAQVGAQYCFNPYADGTLAAQGENWVEFEDAVREENKVPD